MSTETLKTQESVVEAVLFTMGQSVEIRQLAAALEATEKEAEAAAERLRNRYEKTPGGMQIVRLEDSYQMCTRAEYYGNLIKVAATPKKQVLTDVVMETLAIIAYKQPVTKADIEKIRGVNADHAVNRLVEYNLVYEAGRLDAPGRPALFATTEEFLRRFGVGSTEQLPEMNLEQREEIRSEVEEELNLKLDSEGRLLDEAEAEGTEAEDAEAGGIEAEDTDGETEAEENAGEEGTVTEAEARDDAGDAEVKENVAGDAGEENADELTASSVEEMGGE